MMGGPIDARRNPTSVNDLASDKRLQWFETHVIHEVPFGYAGQGRRVYPGFLQHAGFIAMNPGRHMRSHTDFYRHLVKGDLEDAQAHRRFYDEYNAVLDMPAEYYLDCIRIVFQRCLLPRGLWCVGGERVAPEALTSTALLTIEGELDDISGIGQTQAAPRSLLRHPDSKKRHLMIEGAGHYGIFSGRSLARQYLSAGARFHRRRGQRQSLAARTCAVFAGMCAPGQVRAFTVIVRRAPARSSLLLVL